MEPKFRCKIHDIYDIHTGFWLDLRPGIYTLVGPNGAGKSTLLRQVEEIAKHRSYDVLHYSNLTDGGQTAMQLALAQGHMRDLACAASASEGQNIVLNFGRFVPKISAAIQKTRETGTPLFILLDALDSGTSIDKLRSIRTGLFDLILRDIRHAGGNILPVYVLVAANSYELAQGRCVDVRTGKIMTFRGYEDYARFITHYFDGHTPKHNA